ncbi:MAG TPA: GMC family oxidoreductase N-terminal domain-containing protein, partial [Actinomycetota bacterium]|nr:GMC family oxidoreductase N-terminal domain-containing protein [Actinomycetota bacterium]
MGGRERGHERGRRRGSGPLTDFDAVVIGSGFGGAVVAARLAEAGRSVCVLERGRRWSAPEYPRTFSQAAAGVWDEETSYGFLEYRVFARMDVIQGCGVGGGSLHYFNVQLRAPAAIFDRGTWPAALTRATLDRYYERAEDVMRPAPLVPPAGYPMPPRTEAFIRAAEAAGYEPFLVPIAVHTGETRPNPVSGIVQEACRYTADCLLGCRPRAKNSLDITYLPMGERHGLEVRPLHVVDRIEPAGGEGDGYVVTARRLDPDRPGVSEPAQVSGRSVVLAAGALGTSELLLRARDVDQTLPALPAWLGERFSPNGDMLFA